MDKIELSKYGFKKYEAKNVESLLSHSGFKQVKTQVIEEPELEFDGKPFVMYGIYTIGNKT